VGFKQSGCRGSEVFAMKIQYCSNIVIVLSAIILEELFPPNLTQLLSLFSGLLSAGMAVTFFKKNKPDYY